MAVSTRTFRVFVSSTFNDLHAERNALHKDVFPAVRALCERNGARFQAIDLRWGVPHEAALDQQTVRICLEEIERCRRSSPRPNFIILLGDRYGWRPPPSEIPTEEFTGILASLGANPDGSPRSQLLLEEWYQRDDNAIPTVYCLRPRRGQVEDPSAWAVIEQRLRETLLAATRDLSLTPSQRQRYEASATEQEIERGALAVDDADQHVFAFMRTISALPADGQAAEFRDVDGDGRRDAEADARLRDLKRRLASRLGANVHAYDASWVTSARAPTTDHLPRLCADVQTALTQVIEREIEALATTGQLEREIEEHARFRADRCRFFTGRDDLLQEIKQYLSDDDRRYLAVVGDSGTGKSSLMAKGAEQALVEHPERILTNRFLGTTPGSTDVRTLLESLCREISRRYSADEDVPTDHDELVQEFPKRMALATAQKPLVVFLDALDQLVGPTESEKLGWLPIELPPHVRLVASFLTSSDDEGPPDVSRRLVCGAMPLDEAERLLDLWLSDAGRTLQPAQRTEVLEKFAAAGGLPLYLKLAFEESRRWRSFDSVPQLNATVDGIVGDLLDRLSLEANHGAAIVSRGLGYLAAARNGLTEDELIDVLSDEHTLGEPATETVLHHFMQRARHTPPEPRLPVVVWSRLFFELEPYFIERRADGTTLLTFYHRQVREAIERRFLSGAHKLRRHAALASYFDRHVSADETRRIPNLRRLSELPYQQASAERWDALHDTLTDFEFLQDKCTHAAVTTHGDVSDTKTTHGGVYELYGDYLHALKHFPRTSADAVKRQDLEEWQEFIRADAHILAESPGLLFQNAANEPAATAPGRLAQQPRPPSLPRITWLRVVNKDDARARASFVLSGHQNPIRDCELSTETTRVVSADDETVKLWNANDGRPIASRPVARVQQVGFSRDGSFVLVNTEAWERQPRPGRARLAIYPLLRVYDSATLQERRALKGHRWIRGNFTIGDGQPAAVSMLTARHLQVWNADTNAALGSMPVPIGGTGSFGPRTTLLSPRGDLLACALEDSEITIWDVRSGERLATLTGHLDLVECLAFSPDGTRLASGAGDAAALGHSDHVVIIWDLRQFREIVRLRGHSAGVRSVAFSPDGSILASASIRDDSTLRLWDAHTGAELARLRCEDRDLSWCAISPNGAFVAAGCGFPGAQVTIWRGTFGGHAARDVSLTWQTPASGNDLQDATGAFSPDSGRIVGASIIRRPGYPFPHERTEDSRQLRVLDTNNGSLLEDLVGEPAAEHRFRQIGFSPDGTRVAALQNDRSTIKIWNTASGRLDRQLLASPHEMLSFGFIEPSGELLVVSEEVHGELWDPVARKTIADFPSIPPWGLFRALSPDGSRCAVTYNNLRLEIRDTSNGALSAEYVETGGDPDRQHQLNDATFSPNGGRLAVATGAGTALLDAATGSLLARHGEVTSQVAFSPDGTRLISDKRLLLDGHSLKELGMVSEAEAFVGQVCRFSSDGQLVVFGNENHVEVRGATYAGRSRPSTDRRSVSEVHFSPDGSYLVTSRDCPRATLTDTRNGETSEPVEDAAPVTEARVSYNSRHLATVTVDSVRLWDLRAGTLIRSWTGADLGGKEEVDGCLFGPARGCFIIAMNGASLYLWHPKLERRWFRKLIALRGHLDGCWKWVAFTPDGRAVLTSDGRLTRMFDSDSGKMLWQLPAACQPVAYPQALSASGLLARRNGSKFEIWDVSRRNIRRSFALDGTHDRIDFAGDISPDGGYAAAAWNKQLTVWGMSDKHPRSYPVGDTRKLAFSADGSCLALWNTRSVRILRVHDGSEISRYITADEIVRSTGEWNPQPLHQLAFGDRAGRTYLLQLESS